MPHTPPEPDNLLSLREQRIEQCELEIQRLSTYVGQLQANLQLKENQLNRLDQIKKVNQNLVIAAIDAQTTEAKALAANSRQEEFLLMLAHELRNPLAPIGLANELIGKIKNAHSDLPQLHAIISRQTGHINRLVDDLLDASRISTGKFALQLRTLKLSDVIDMAVETSRPSFEKRHQKIIIALPSHLIVIDGDLDRLAQVFSNLLINASKFTAEFGTVTISVHQIGQLVNISVKDNGIGIHLNLQKCIFDLFVQGYKSFSRPQGGLGIGLALARTIVEMHNGTIAVSSDGAGRGSEFVVQLAVSGNFLPATTEKATNTNAHRPIKILLVEDNVDTNAVLSNLLQLEGHQVKSAFDGAEGLAQTSREQFDIIICDIGLPDMTGYELVEQLQRPVPLIIALSGYNPQVHSDQNKCFDYYLVKPIKFQTVLDIIGSHPVSLALGDS